MNSEFPDPLAAQPLSEEEISFAVKLLLDPLIPDSVKGRFLTCLHQRGETARELAGFAHFLLSHAIRPMIRRRDEAPLLELCGTGGDKAGLLNISTAAMFVAAGAGARVVKHGGRAVSSRCGSADVLEMMGVDLHLEPQKAGEVLDHAGCIFMLASDFHPTVAAVADLRRTLAAKGQMTIFNLLGPLLNPALPDCQLAGIYTAAKLELYAEALSLLGRRKAWAVHGEGVLGEDGFDEISITGRTNGVSATGGKIERFTIHPKDLGFPRYTSGEDLIGGDAEENARRISAILECQEHGAARDMIVLNAATALHIAGFGDTLLEAVQIARESIDSGSAYKSLRLLREASQANQN